MDLVSNCTLNIFLYTSRLVHLKVLVMKASSWSWVVVNSELQLVKLRRKWSVECSSINDTSTTYPLSKVLGTSLKSGTERLKSQKSGRIRTKQCVLEQDHWVCELTALVITCTRLAQDYATYQFSMKGICAHNLAWGVTGIWLLFLDGKSVF